MLITSTELSRDRYDRLWRHLWANTHAGGPLARTRYRLALKWLRLNSASRERTLDVGAGNGAFMLEALRQAPSLQLYGAEFSQGAIDLAPENIRHRLALCDLQAYSELPWGGNFQLITCMEVLEHLPDDVAAIDHLVRALAPGGRLFISVPAWPALWGPQDATAGHVRRYEPIVMRERLESAGLRVVRMHCWGGPLTWMYRQAINLMGPETVMSIRPRGSSAVAAHLIFQCLRLDDVLSFGRGPQLLVLADTANV